MSTQQPNIENERSFLVRELPNLAEATAVEIEQHYLDDDASPLRLRRRGDECEITRKFDVDPNDFSRKDERNLPLTLEQFELLKPLTKRQVVKTRYCLPLADGLTAELDVYHGPLEGLVTVEVEFPNEASRTAFVPPDWFGRDISQESWSANAYLADKSFAEIEPLLD